jgi:hypothetical protein
LVASSLRSPARFVPCAAASTSAGVVPPAPPVTRASGSASTCSATQSKNAESFLPPSFLSSFAGAGAPPSCEAAAAAAAAAAASCACFAAPLRRHAPSQRAQSHSGRLGVGIARLTAWRPARSSSRSSPRAAGLPVVRALYDAEELAPARALHAHEPVVPPLRVVQRAGVAGRGRGAVEHGSQSGFQTFALGAPAATEK